MKPVMLQLKNIEAMQLSLQARGAAQWDAVGWHYLQVLAQRSRAQTGAAQDLLNDKLLQALQNFQTRMNAANPVQPTREHSRPGPSPLGTLVNDMTRPALAAQLGKPSNWRPDKPHIQQFRQQLGKIRVQKQVSLAIAQAPQNAGPINSHMLVLRSLGLMRDLSPEYLSRFMGYVETLLCLDEAGQGKVQFKKTASSKPEK